jgi:hypothetical protein
MADAQRRIQEAEIMEAKRRRRMAKIQAMASDSKSCLYHFITAVCFSHVTMI